MDWPLLILFLSLLTGFSLGDELGFRESLSNVESLNRRSVHSARSAAGYFQPLFSTTKTPSPLISPSSTSLRIGNNKSESSTVASNRSSHAINLRSPHISPSQLQQQQQHALTGNVVPPFRPIHPGGHQKSSHQVTRVTKVRGGDEDPVTIVGVPAFATLPPSIAKIPLSHSSQLASNAVANNRRISYNPLVNQQQQLLLQQSSNMDPLPLASNSIAQLRVVAPAVPSTGTVADPLLPEAVGHALKNVAQATNISADALLASIQLRQQQILYQQQKQLAALAAAATSTTTTSQAPATNPVYVPNTSPASAANPFANNAKNTFVPGGGSDNDNEVTGSGVTVAYASPTGTGGNGVGTGGNAALEQLSSQRTNAKSPTRQKYTMAGAHKVMNAPKEYYPVNYDKNFDDNFTSRVELPDTSFNCGDQKHFPGLYADEDLSCMVFHVCALTDDGLVMKSFLCPESTLFDQTILKCNWWFYVDCKASKKLYDSNIPISKSYQLMKALTFFSSYNKNEKSPLPSSPTS